jgi:uncharacterized membrane protein HdeD (DUF308 family)
LGWFLVFGIVLMVLGGAACIAKSQIATTFSVLAPGWVLAIGGVVWPVGAFQTRTWGRFFMYLPKDGQSVLTSSSTALP